METQTTPANTKCECICHARGLKLEDKALFIYFGHAEPGVYFFLHMYCADRPMDLLEKLCVGVYDCMIQETMIRSGDNVVVFNQQLGEPNSRPATHDATIRPIRVTHEEFAAVQCSGERLAAAYEEFIETDRSEHEDTLVVVAELHAGVPVRYSLHELPNIFACQKRMKPLGSTKLEDIQLEPIVDTRTFEAIPYLESVAEVGSCGSVEADGDEKHDCEATELSGHDEIDEIDEDTKNYLAEVVDKFLDSPLVDAIKLLANV